LITFHKTLAGCEAGNPEAWRAFLGDYTPVVYQLFDVYLPALRDGRAQLWEEMLLTLAANNFERLRSFDRQAEREFLADLRSFLLERGGTKLEPAEDISRTPRPAPDTVNALLKGLPLVHQEVLLLKLAGYSDGTLEKMLRITPAIAQRGLERLQADYSAALKKDRDACLWPAAWLKLLAHARSARSADCPPLRQFVRILDGQTSWYEKEPIEKHVGLCLHCLERWTALRELIYWRHGVERLPEAEVKALVSGLSLRGEPKKEKPFLKRVLGA
jgi:hypothetical protein